MLITKLSYVGAAGLGIALALGGVQTLAFQGRGEARQNDSASAAARKSGDQAKASPPSATVDPQSVDRIDSMVLSLRAIGDDLDEAMRQLVHLQARLRTMEAELGPIRRGLSAGRPPTSSIPPTPATPPTPAKKVENDGESDRPQYISLGQEIVVISPDGARAAIYDLRSDKSKTLKLPMLYGVHREFLGPPADVHQGPNQGRPGPAIKRVPGPWLTSLELDDDRRVVRILALNVREGTVVDVVPARPFVDRSSVTVSPSGDICLGDAIYAFTGKRWSPLLGVSGRPRFEDDAMWAEKRGRLFRFNYATGEWDDIYAHALEGRETMKAFDTRDAPAQ